MKKITLSALLLLTINLYSQNDWSKTDRSNLYEEFVSDLIKYKFVTENQKESISLCCLETITNKYSKSVYSGKIEVELKRLKESTIDQCAKNIGLQLEKEESKVDSPKIDLVTEEWTKEDKSNLVKQVSKSLEAYPKLSTENKDNIALCYMDATCENLSKVQYNNMISIEQERYIKTTIEKCASKQNINLNEVPIIQPTTNVINKQFLVGSWKTDQNMTLTFNEDGTFIKVYNTDFVIANRYTHIENSTVKGDWFLDNKGELTLVENWIELEYKLLKTNRYRYSETGKYNFINNSADYFKMSFTSGVYCCQDNSPQQIIQANRIK